MAYSNPLNKDEIQKELHTSLLARSGFRVLGALRSGLPEPRRYVKKQCLLGCLKVFLAIILPTFWGPGRDSGFREQSFGFQDSGLGAWGLYPIGPTIGYLGL